MNTLELIHRYYTPGTEQEEILRRHSEDVTQLALRLVDAHPELSLDAPGIHCTGEAPYLLHGYLGAELLRSLGLPRHARVAERHTGSGLTREEIVAHELPLPEGYYMPETLEEQVICYADKFFSKTKLGQQKSLEKVRKGFTKHGAAALERFDVLHERFGAGLDFIV